MTHDERVYHHLYETNEGIAEQSERIASLEELVLDMWQVLAYANAGYSENDELRERISELGVTP